MPLLRWPSVFVALLDVPAIATKLGAKSFLAVLESLAASNRKSLYDFCLPTLLDTQAAQQLPTDMSFQALYMLADKGHAVSPALKPTWMTPLTQV